MDRYSRIARGIDLKFTIETDKLKNGLENVQVKGKGTTNNGFGNTIEQLSGLDLKINSYEVKNPTNPTVKNNN